jgi:L-threonylcarbamoyladenylate synthase
MTTALSIEDAAVRLREGAVVAYPTEGVWGLGCDPANEAAVRRLLAIKQREVGKGLILIAASLAQLRPCLDLDALPADRLDEARASWPGPHTWILPASAAAPRWITGDHDGIAVRVSAHPPVAALCEAFGGALVSTSANLSGRPAPRHRGELDPALLRLLDGVTEGETGGLSRPTPIRDARSGAELRS